MLALGFCNWFLIRLRKFFSIPNLLMVLSGKGVVASALGVREGDQGLAF